MHLLQKTRRDVTCDVIELYEIVKSEILRTTAAHHWGTATQQKKSLSSGLLDSAGHEGLIVTTPLPFC